jgi:cytochrome c oxidase cbb3-type subunit 4
MNFLEMNIDLVRGLIMVGLIIAFLGMWAWAWSSKRKDVFYEASMLPLEDDDGHIPQESDENHAGRPSTTRPAGVEE